MTAISVSTIDISATDWAAALEEGDGLAGVALQQAPAYGALMAAVGRRVRHLALMHDGARIGGAQLVGRSGLWLLSRGPVFVPALPESVHRAALRGIARRVPGALIATPEVPVAGFGLVPLVTPRHHALWSLSPDTEAQRAALHPKWRAALSRAERSGLRVEPDPSPAWLLGAEARQRRARGYRALPADFVTGWGCAAPGSLLALSARDAAGARIAGAIFLCHGTGASYQIGWSGPAGRAAQAHNLILWQAARQLAEAGVRWLDLGAVDGEAGAGRLRFKAGTGAQIRSLGATCLVLPG